MCGKFVNGVLLSYYYFKSHPNHFTPYYDDEWKDYLENTAFIIFLVCKNCSRKITDDPDEEDEDIMIPDYIQDKQALNYLKLQIKKDNEK